MGAPGRFEGQVVVITGGASGIGKATALRFAQEGAVVRVLDVQREAGSATVDEIARANGVAAFDLTDITDESSVDTAIARIVAEHGRVDVLFNNAGGSTLRDAPVHELELAEFWRCISVDLAGTVIMSKRVLPEMIAARRGAIVNACSTAAIIGIGGISAYTAAKGGIAALTRAMAVDYAPYGIRVNAVAPGWTRTERVVNIAAVRGDEDERGGRVPLGLFGDPGNIADGVLFLASAAAERITGLTLPVDGGLTAT